MDATLSKYTKKAHYFSLLDDVSQQFNHYVEVQAINSEVSSENNINVDSILLSELDSKIGLLANQLALLKIVVSSAQLYFPNIKHKPS